MLEENKIKNEKLYDKNIINVSNNSRR